MNKIRASTCARLADTRRSPDEDGPHRREIEQEIVQLPQRYRSGCVHVSRSLNQPILRSTLAVRNPIRSHRTRAAQARAAHTLEYERPHESARARTAI